MPRPSRPADENLESNPIRCERIASSEKLLGHNGQPNCSYHWPVSNGKWFVVDTFRVFRFTADSNRLFVSIISILPVGGRTQMTTTTTTEWCARYSKETAATCVYKQWRCPLYRKRPKCIWCNYSRTQRWRFCTGIVSQCRPKIFSWCWACGETIRANRKSVVGRLLGWPPRSITVLDFFCYCWRVFFCLFGNVHFRYFATH